MLQNGSAGNGQCVYVGVCVCVRMWLYYIIYYAADIIGIQQCRTWFSSAAKQTQVANNEQVNKTCI